MISFPHGLPAISGTSLCMDISPHDSYSLFASFPTCLTLHIYVTMTCYPVCLLLFTLHFPAPVFSPSHIFLPPHIPMPVCSHLVTFPICLPLVFCVHIWLIDHVCFCSSYIGFNCLVSYLHLTWSLTPLDIFQPPEIIQLSIGNDRGNPWVWKPIPLPLPRNTAPVWWGVRFNCGFCG